MPQRILPVDRDALLHAVTARGERLLGTWLELADGTLHPLIDGDDTAAGRAFEARMDANPDGFSKVPVYAREYRLMTEFVETVEDDALAAALDAALAGREAFRRFEQVLAGDPAEAARWATFRGAALEAWATAWLRSQGLAAHWSSPAGPSVERPVVLDLLLVDGPVVRAAADRHAARELFVRICRELCELLREPFRKGDVRGRSRFARAGVEVRLDGSSVTILPVDG
jgi:hypothetical protein